MSHIDDRHGYVYFFGEAADVGGVFDAALEGEAVLAFEVGFEDLEKAETGVGGELCWR